MTNDERKAVERAQATLATLTPTTPRDDAIAFDLRYASRLMADDAARMGGFAGEATLNDLREDAAIKLNSVAVSLDRRTLTQDMIDKAREAVAAVLDQLRS